MVAVIQTSSPLALPPQETPLLDGQLASQPYWRFFQGLYRRNAVSVPYTTSSGLTATGTTQADAFALLSEWNEITSTPASSGAIIPTFGIGLNTWVWNVGGATLKVYPPIGGAIDALGTNNPYSLANNKAQMFSQITATQFRSLQLG